MIAWGWKFALLDTVEYYTLNANHESWFGDYQNPTWNASWNLIQVQSQSWVDEFGVYVD